MNPDPERKAGTMDDLTETTRDDLERARDVAQELRTAERLEAAAAIERLAERATGADYMRGWHAGRADVREQETDCGLRNHETFAVQMYLVGNLTGAETRREVRELVREAIDDSTGGEHTRESVAGALEDHVTARAAVTSLGHPRGVTLPWSLELASELITACLQRVDWRELADVEIGTAAEEQETAQ